MKIKDLKKILNNLDENYDDFDIRLCNHIYGRSSYGLDIDFYELVELSDIGHSGKVIHFSIEEDN
ncbi:MAG: hypothetical protein ACRCX2_11420 [Paraclostridium sp.]